MTFTPLRISNFRYHDNRAQETVRTERVGVLEVIDGEDDSINTDDEQYISAIVIQSVFRGHRTKNRVKTKKRLMDSHPPNAATTSAATAIQAAFRGRQTRQQRSTTSRFGSVPSLAVGMQVGVFAEDDADMNDFDRVRDAEVVRLAANGAEVDVRYEDDNIGTETVAATRILVAQDVVLVKGMRVELYAADDENHVDESRKVLATVVEVVSPPNADDLVKVLLDDAAVPARGEVSIEAESMVVVAGSRLELSLDDPLSLDEALNVSASLIQAQFRAHRERKAHLKRVEGVKRLQAQFRGASTRKNYASVRVKVRRPIRQLKPRVKARPVSGDQPVSSKSLEPPVSKQHDRTADTNGDAAAAANVAVDTDAKTEAEKAERAAIINKEAEAAEQAAAATQEAEKQQAEGAAAARNEAEMAERAAASKREAEKIEAAETPAASKEVEAVARTAASKKGTVKKKAEEPAASQQKADEEVGQAAATKDDAAKEEAAEVERATVVAAASAPNETKKLDNAQPIKSKPPRSRGNSALAGSSQSTPIRDNGDEPGYVREAKARAAAAAAAANGQGQDRSDDDDDEDNDAGGFDEEVDFVEENGPESTHNRITSVQSDFSADFDADSRPTTASTSQPPGGHNRKTSTASVATNFSEDFDDESRPGTANSTGGKQHERMGSSSSVRSDFGDDFDDESRPGTAVGHDGGSNTHEIRQESDDASFDDDFDSESRPGTAVIGGRPEHEFEVGNSVAVFESGDTEMEDEEASRDAMVTRFVSPTHVEVRYEADGRVETVNVARLALVELGSEGDSGVAASASGAVTKENEDVHHEFEVGNSVAVFESGDTDMEDEEASRDAMVTRLASPTHVEVRYEADGRVETVNVARLALVELGSEGDSGVAASASGAVTKENEDVHHEFEVGNSVAVFESGDTEMEDEEASRDAMVTRFVSPTHVEVRYEADGRVETVNVARLALVELGSEGDSGVAASASGAVTKENEDVHHEFEVGNSVAVFESGDTEMEDEEASRDAMVTRFVSPTHVEVRYEADGRVETVNVARLALVELGSEGDSGVAASASGAVTKENEDVHHEFEVGNSVAVFESGDTEMEDEEASRDAMVTRLASPTHVEVRYEADGRVETVSVARLALVELGSEGDSGVAASASGAVTKENEDVHHEFEVGNSVAVFESGDTDMEDEEASRDAMVTRLASPTHVEVRYEADGRVETVNVARLALVELGSEGDSGVAASASGAVTKENEDVHHEFEVGNSVAVFESGDTEMEDEEASRDAMVTRLASPTHVEVRYEADGRVETVSVARLALVELGSEGDSGVAASASGAVTKENEDVHHEFEVGNSVAVFESGDTDMKDEEASRDAMVTRLASPTHVEVRYEADGRVETVNVARLALVELGSEGDSGVAASASGAVTKENEDVHHEFEVGNSVAVFESGDTEMEDEEASRDAMVTRFVSPTHVEVRYEADGRVETVNVARLALVELGSEGDSGVAASASGAVTKENEDVHHEFEVGNSVAVFESGDTDMEDEEASRDAMVTRLASPTHVEVRYEADGRVETVNVARLALVELGSEGDSGVAASASGAVTKENEDVHHEFEVGNSVAVFESGDTEMEDEEASRDAMVTRLASPTHVEVRYEADGRVETVSVARLALVELGSEGDSGVAASASGAVTKENEDVHHEFEVGNSVAVFESGDTEMEDEEASRDAMVTRLASPTHVEVRYEADGRVETVSVARLALVELGSEGDSGVAASASGAVTTENEAEGEDDASFAPGDFVGVFAVDDVELEDEDRMRDAEVVRMTSDTHAEVKYDDDGTTEIVAVVRLGLIEEEDGSGEEEEFDEEEDQD